MPNINDEMKSTADYAINAAKQRFKQELDFSEPSLAKLEKILEQIYWGFSNHPKEEGKGGVIFNTAAIWGSYLGEFMRLKWDGSWIQKGTDRLITISNIEFSPISFVYQKITSHPEYSVENYFSETNRKLYTSAINPKKASILPEIVSQPKKQVSIPQPIQQNSIPQPVKQISIPQPKKFIGLDKRILFAIAGIVGILLVIGACITGYSIIKSGGIPAFGSIASATSFNIEVSVEETLVTATSSSTDTQEPTATLLPTYTPKPSLTPSPSVTPSLTFTQLPTSLPTDTPTLFPTSTRTPRKTPTSPPTDTPRPPEPTSTPTQRPSPTDTQPPPVVLQSCEVNPSTVQGNNDPLTFIAHFSAPGYGFDTVIFNPGFPGQTACGATADGNGDASCPGSAGLLPGGTIVDVTFISSVGNCTAQYRTP